MFSQSFSMNFGYSPFFKLVYIFIDVLLQNNTKKLPETTPSKPFKANNNNNKKKINKSQIGNSYFGSVFN